MSFDLLDALNAYLAAGNLSRRYCNTLRYRLNLWRRLIGNSQCESGNSTSCNRFRAKALHAGYAPQTIEDTISAVVTISKELGHAVQPGRRLRIEHNFATPPHIEEVARCYKSAHVAQWPTSLPPPQRGIWWQSFWLISTWTALRLGDLCQLKWSHVRYRRIEIVANKTGKKHEIPLTDPVLRHLEQLKGITYESVFQIPKQFKQLRREMRRQCDAAGVAKITPQLLRQCGVNLWRKYGGLDVAMALQGCGLGRSIDRYLSQEHLERTSRCIELPVEFLSPEERAAQQNEEVELVRRWKRANSAQRRAIISVARIAGN